MREIEISRIKRENEELREELELVRDALNVATKTLANMRLDLDAPVVQQLRDMRADRDEARDVAERLLESLERVSNFMAHRKPTSTDAEVIIHFVHSAVRGLPRWLRGI